MKTRSLPLRDWFLYVDRADYAPDQGGMVTTHAFTYHSEGAQESEAWTQEEWGFQAALIPLDQSHSGEMSVARTAAQSISAHDECEFEPWWRDPDDFDFGDVRYVDRIIAWPWLHHWPHRLDDEQLVITPRSDFLRYHALDRRSIAGEPEGSEYVHPPACERGVPRS